MNALNFSDLLGLMSETSFVQKLRNRNMDYRVCGISGFNLYRDKFLIGLFGILQLVCFDCLLARHGIKPNEALVVEVSSAARFYRSASDGPQGNAFFLSFFLIPWFDLKAKKAVGRQSVVRAV